MSEHEGCTGCRWEHASYSDSYHCSGCIQNSIDKYERLTNGSRLKSMSDDELAEFLEGEYGNFELGTALKWLQSPAETEE